MCACRKRLFLWPFPAKKFTMQAFLGVLFFYFFPVTKILDFLLTKIRDLPGPVLAANTKPDLLYYFFLEG